MTLRSIKPANFLRDLISIDELLCNFGVLKILGKIVSCVRALGQTIKIFLRSSQYALDRQVLQQGWDSAFTIPSNVAEDLLFVRDNIDSKNGSKLTSLSYLNDT